MNSNPHDGAVLTVRGLDLMAGPRMLACGATFEVAAGECLGLTGSNGTGKSTLLETLAGRVESSEGAVNYGNAVLQASGGWRNGIGYMSADLVAPAGLTVREFLHVLAVARGMSDGEWKSTSTAHAQAVDLHTHLDQNLIVLSTGQRKKLGFVAALMHSPGLLLCDEPFEGLDEQSADAVSGLLSRYVSSGGSAIVCTHRTRFLHSLADRSLVIQDERIFVDEGSNARNRPQPTP